MKNYLLFAGRNWRPLGFGAILVSLSSFGQTYYVSLFGAAFRGAFGLSDGELGTLYGISTVLSALTLTWAGRLIDHTTVHRYSWSVAALLSAACLLTAAAPFGAMLLVCFYLLRLGGQGLMIHTAMTSTARTFPRDAGKALGIVLVGFSFAQAVFPPLAVAGINIIGWRATWVVAAAVVVGGVAFALRLVPKREDDAGVSRERQLATAPSLWRDPRMLLALPAVLAAPFIGTGFFFHQARLAEEKGWMLSWIAAWFVAYALAQATTNIAIGPIIDRMGPRRIMPFFLAPLAVAMLTLSASDSVWTAPIYLILTGITSAVASNLATALWVDLYGPERLARVRSTVEALLVIASGASPALFGLLIDAGIPLAEQALGSFVYIVAVSLLATRISRIARTD